MTEKTQEYKIKLLALLAEVAETDEIVLEIEGADDTLAADELKQILAGLPILAEHEDLIQKSALAINFEVAGPDTQVRPEDEIAFLPPVSGG